MDKKITVENLKEAIFDVLKTMFFEPLQAVEKDIKLLDWFSQKQPLFEAKLAFSGPKNGFFYMIVPESVATEITANFLGIDEDETDNEQKIDTIKEALNMIGGKVFSFFDRAGEYKLHIPELIRIEAHTYELLEEINGKTVLIELTDNRLAAGVRIDT